MAKKRSAKYPYKWSNGTWHSRPERPTDRPSQAPRKPDPFAPGGTAYEAANTAMTGLNQGTLAVSGRQLVPTQIPLDPYQEAARVSSQRNLGISEAQSAYETGRIENEYGLGLDKSNPYSRARLLEESYKRSKLGTTNSYAAQGQLYSGAYQRMQGENTRNYSMGYDQLARGYGDALRGIQLGRLQAYGEYGTAGDEAAFQALLRAYRRGG